MTAHQHPLFPSTWGPFSKCYAGISHIADPMAGVRVDLSVFPGLYRRCAHIPNVRTDSGFMPIEAAADLTFYRYRHEMPQAVKMACDIAYERLEENLIRCSAEFVNESDAPEIAVLHAMVSLHPPPLGPNLTIPLEPGVPELPPGGLWIDAVKDAIEIHAPRTNEPRAGLVWSGRIRGQFDTHDAVHGMGLGAGVLGRAGDRVRWAGTLSNALESATLCMRARVREGGPVRLSLRIGERHEHVVIVDSGENWTWTRVRLQTLPAGRIEVEAEALAEGRPEIDGFALVDSRAAEEVRVVRKTWRRAPALLPGPMPNSAILHYPDLDTLYGIAWGDDPFQIRQFICDEFDALLSANVNNQVKERFEAPGANGHYTNIYLRPIEVAGHTRVRREFLFCCGTEKQVRNGLTIREASASRGVQRPPCLPSGEPLRLGFDRMSAITLTNIVYPIRRRGVWIAHYTPGRWWDSLYTWDAGFHAIGLANLEPSIARRHIETYLIGEEAPDECAFVHWGTPIPTQFHALNVLAQRAPGTVDWMRLFPALRRAHDFLAGHHPSSTTNPFASGLLVTWDYFYNSGGWDDYPPQVFVHARALEKRVAPVSNTAHSLRFAKWLNWIAPHSMFAEDMVRLTNALQRHAWDPDAGVFSYVIHDDAGQPQDVLRHESGINYNLGMDGILPLTAGICNEAQVNRLVQRLFDPAGMWTPIGITTVDQRAPYYRRDGYWNGAVWFPHQWMIWKSLLDHGFADEAWRIADTALRLWQTEVERSGRCFEHFIVRGGRGAGWHQFGGLSCPILDWFAAYHQPGRLTGGLDAMVRSLTIGSEWTAELDVLDSVYTRGPVLIATVGEDGPARAAWNGDPVIATRRLPGTLEIRLPSRAGRGILKIT